MNLIKKPLKLTKDVIELVSPFGRRQLIIVFVLMLTQGSIQALGVFSILPFLGLATNPQSAINSGFGKTLTNFFPFVTVGNIVVVSGIATVLLLTTSSLMNGITDYAKMRYTSFTGMRIGTRLLYLYAYQPYVFHIKHNSADLTKRLQSDVNMFMSGVLAPLLDIFSRSIGVLLLGILLFIVNPWVCLTVIIIFSSFLALAYAVFRQSLVQGSRDRKILIEKRFRYAHELLTGIKTATIHRCQDHFISGFQRSWQGVANHDTFLVVAGNGPRYTIEAITFSALVILILVLEVQGRSFEDFLPTLVFFVVASYRILPALQIIYGQVAQIQSKHFTLEVLREDLIQLNNRYTHTRLVGSMHGSINLMRGIIFDSVTYQYPGAEKSALINLRLKIEAGNRVGIVGPSGAGKSTLVDLIIGLLQPTQGQIIIDDTALLEHNISIWQSLVGYVSQDIFLLDDTIERNIAFGISHGLINSQKLIHSAQIAQIHSYIQHDLPDGYQTMCGERGVRLSGGQRQRIALARALYHQPQVLVFDEATSALDSETERSLMAAIENLPSHITTIMIAHRLSTVKNCDQIFVLENGQLSDQGSYDNLLSRSAIFKQLALQSS